MRDGVVQMAQAYKAILDNTEMYVRYNVTLGHVRATVVVVEKQYILRILSVCL